MKQHAVPFLFLCLSAAACGGSPKPPVVVAEPPPPSDAGNDGDGDEPPEDDDLEVVSTRGKIDPDAVTQAIQPHAGALEACYADNVGRRRWLGGAVELRWDVAADGVVTSVRLVQSTLGAWTIEKCVLDIARQLSFGKPKGGKAHVTNSVDFSLGAGAMPWTEEQTTKAVNGKLKDLAACSKAAATAEPTNVTVTMYVGTRGKVQSVGFASPTGFDDAWADCVAGKAMTWSLTDPRGKVAKAAFVYNPAAIDPDEYGEEL